MHAFEAGLIDIFEKLAKVKFSRKAMAGHLAEFGELPKTVVQKISPGQKRQVEKTVQKRVRREAGTGAKLRPDRMTPSQVIAQKRLSRGSGTVVGPPQSLSKAPTAVDPARARLFKTPASMMHSSTKPGSVAAIEHVFTSSR
jgi:hypothetical protein